MPVIFQTVIDGVKQAFHTFNNQVAMDLDIQNYSGFKRTRIENLIALNMNDCEPVARLVCEFLQRSSLSNLAISKKRTRVPSDSAGVETILLNNSIYIRLTDSYDGCVIFVRQKTSWSQLHEDCTREMYFGKGALKLTKIFGARVSFGPNGEYGGVVRIVIMSRTMEMPFPCDKVTRQQKIKYLQEFIVKHFQEASNWYLETNIDETSDTSEPVMFLWQIYHGLRLSIIQNAFFDKTGFLYLTFLNNPAAYLHMKIHFISSLLLGTYNIMKKNIWVNDLKPDNICCLYRSPSSCFDTTIIDWIGSNGSTFGLFKSGDTPNPAHRIERYVRILKQLNSPKRFSMSTLDFVDARFQLMFEIVHLIYIFSAFPKVYWINELLYQKQMTERRQTPTGPICIVPNPNTYTATCWSFKTNGMKVYTLQELTNIVSASELFFNFIYSGYRWDFKTFLEHVRNVTLGMDSDNKPIRIPWSDEANKMLTQFGELVDNWCNPKFKVRTGPGMEDLD